MQRFPKIAPVAALIAAAVLVAAPAARAAMMPTPPSDLTLDQAIDRAMRHNPQVQAAQSQADAADANAHAAYFWPLKAVSANAGYYTGFNAGAQTPGALFGGGMTGGVGVGVNVGDLLAGGFLAQAAAANAQTAHENLRQVKAAVAAEVTTDYALWVTQKRLLALRREAIAAGQSDVTVAERLFGNGTATISDVYKARLAAGKTNVDLIQAEGEYTRSWATLLGAMGETRWLEAKH